MSRTRSFVELLRVSKIYPPGNIALKDISLSVDKGELIFLTGASGAGKTTLLKLLCGMERHSKGLVEVAGRDLSRIKAGQLAGLRREIGMVYQDFKLLPERTVLENIAMVMEVAYSPQRLIKKRVSELLSVLRLERKRDTPVARLSRGEQQRIAIARAAANRPPLLLADEPTGNLDSEMKNVVMGLFDELNSSGTTVIVASHDEDLYRHTEKAVYEIAEGELNILDPAPLPPAAII